MKTRLMRHSLAAAVAACVLQLPMVSTAFAADFPVVRPGDGERMQMLAEIETADGRFVQFIAFPADGEIVYGETVSAGADEARLSVPTGTALDRFLELTPEHVPVPRLLAELDGLFEAPGDSVGDGRVNTREGAAEGTPRESELSAYNRRVADSIARRGLVEQLSAPLRLNLLRSGSAAKAGGGSCGADGKNFFEQNHCDTLGPGGYGVGQGHCDSSLSASIQRTSTIRMRHTYTRMVTCGTSGTVKHRYSKVGGWHLQFTSLQTPNTVTSWATSKGGAARFRRASFERIGNVGGIRGWTHFFKQLTD